MFSKKARGLAWEFEVWAVVTPNVVAFLQDVNDHAPECEPPFQELTIYTALGRSMEVTKVSCWIPQEPQRLTLSYSIMGGVKMWGPPGCWGRSGRVNNTFFSCYSASRE